MYVEVGSVNGKEVFRHRERAFAIFLGVFGCLFLLGGFIGFIRPTVVKVEEDPILRVGLYLGCLVIGLGVILCGLVRMFVLETLIVDRAGRLVFHVRRTPLSRTTRSLRFDELDGIRIFRTSHVTNRRRRERRFHLYHATLASLSGNPVTLARYTNDEAGVRSLSRRISELTGTWIRKEY